MDNNEEKMLQNEASSSQGIVEKLAQELDKKVVIFPPADVHPLLIDHVVQKIMVFFNVKDLRSARFVCKLWRVEGGRQILIKSHLCPKFELTEEELLNFLSLAKPSEPLKLFCGKKDIQNIIQKFPKLAERVKELKYKNYTEREYYHDKDLIETLDSLPCLEILDTNSLSFKKDQIADEWNQICLDKLESMKEIRFDFPFSSNNPFLWTFGSRLKNVSKIRLDEPDVSTVNFLISHQVEWPLNHVTLKLVVNPQVINQGLIRKFFIKNSNTLKFLDIRLVANERDHRNLTTQTPWEDDWLIPVGFPVLETMIISGSDKNVLSLLIIALRLPRLKKLVLSHAPLFIERKINVWEHHPLAAGKKLQSLSIEQVELTTQITYHSLEVLKGIYWPNLKYLKLNLKHKWGFESNCFLPSLLPSWEELERLELNLYSIKSSELESYQKWLTGGIQFPGNYKKGSDLHGSPASKLVDLKNLRSLTIYLPQGSFLLGDFLVYNCLQFMTNLQSLRFGGQSVISGEALNVLKNKLGHIVSFLDKETKKQS